jgi:hypothetical protein
VEKDEHWEECIKGIEPCAPFLGTRWTADGEGSTVGQLYLAFSSNSGEVERDSILLLVEADAMSRTNLELTGAPITVYDRERLESLSFKIQ